MISIMQSTDKYTSRTKFVEFLQLQCSHYNQTVCGKTVQNLVLVLKQCAETALQTQHTES